MKFDITRLPIAEAVVGFLIVATVATFVAAFTFVDPIREDAGEPVVTEPPDTGGSATPVGDLAIVMQDNSFDPNELTLAAGEVATIALTNEGAAIHNMRIAGADGKFDTGDDAVSDPDAMRAGQDGTIEWTLEATGEVDFRCDFHPIEMVGTITVQ